MFPLGSLFCYKIWMVSFWFLVGIFREKKKRENPQEMWFFFYIKYQNKHFLYFLNIFT